MPTPIFSYPPSVNMLKQSKYSSYYKIDNDERDPRPLAPEYLIKRSNVNYKSVPLLKLKEKGMWNPRLEKLIPYLPTGAWIAGGFLRAMVAGEDELKGDLDLFFHNERALEKTIDMLKTPLNSMASKVFGRYRNGLPDGSHRFFRVLNYDPIMEDRPRIQLVKLLYFDSPEHVIDSFDFSVAQLATDGEALFYHPQTFDDIRNRVIRLHKYNGEPIVILNRLLKYEEKGYHADPEEFRKVADDAAKMLVNAKQIDKYFYTDAVRADSRKVPASFLKHAFKYLSQSPDYAKVIAKIIGQKEEENAQPNT